MVDAPLGLSSKTLIVFVFISNYIVKSTKIPVVFPTRNVLVFKVGVKTMCSIGWTMHIGLVGRFNVKKN